MAIRWSLASYPIPGAAEYHRRVVDAPPATTFGATQQFSLDESAIVRTIIRVRAFMLGVRAQTQAMAGRRAIPRARAGAVRDVRQRRWVKIVWSIAVDSFGPNRAGLRTETRVATTDPAARARFRRYWALFSPGILLIRHEALRVIANTVEH